MGPPRTENVIPATAPAVAAAAGVIGDAERPAPLREPGQALPERHRQHDAERAQGEQGDHEHALDEGEGEGRAPELDLHGEQADEGERGPDPEQVVDRPELAGVGRAEHDQGGGDREVEREERNRAGAHVAAPRRRGGVGDEAHLPVVGQFGQNGKEGSGHGP